MVQKSPPVLSTAEHAPCGSACTTSPSTSWISSTGRRRTTPAVEPHQVGPNQPSATRPSGARSGEDTHLTNRPWEPGGIENLERSYLRSSLRLAPRTIPRTIPENSGSARSAAEMAVRTSPFNPSNARFHTTAKTTHEALAASTVWIGLRRIRRFSLASTRADGSSSWRSHRRFIWRHHSYMMNRSRVA